MFAECLLFTRFPVTVTMGSRRSTFFSMALVHVFSFSPRHRSHSKQNAGHMACCDSSVLELRRTYPNHRSRRPWSEMNCCPISEHCLLMSLSEVRSSHFVQMTCCKHQRPNTSNLPISLICNGTVSLPQMSELFFGG